MSETITIEFGQQDKRDLLMWKRFVEEGEVQESEKLERHVVSLPAIQIPSEGERERVEEALKDGSTLPTGPRVSLPEEMIESAKASFIASGGNISEVAKLHDLTPEAVLRLASEESWPVYGGSTKAVEAKSKGQLIALQGKLWHRLETMLDSMEIETKEKRDIVQYRSNSKYVEPLASRSSAFKVLMDQYMRVSTLLEPETFAGDPDGSNYHARMAREERYPGGIEGVNREMADFLSEVVVGVADKIKDRELNGYGQIIDARQ